MEKLNKLRKQIDDIDAAKIISITAKLFEKYNGKKILFMIDEMEKTIDALRESGINVNKMIDLDVRFHELMAEITGNVLFKVLLAPLTELLKESHRKTLKVSGIKAMIASHKKVLKAIKRHSSADARKAMNEKLDETANDIRKAEGR